MIKVSVKEFTVNYCCKRSRKQKSEILTLQNKLDELKNLTDSQNVQNEICDTQIRSFSISGKIQDGGRNSKIKHFSEV